MKCWVLLELKCSRPSYGMGHQHYFNGVDLPHLYLMWFCIPCCLLLSGHWPVSPLPGWCLSLALWTRSTALVPHVDVRLASAGGLCSQPPLPFAGDKRPWVPRTHDCQLTLSLGPCRMACAEVKPVFTSTVLCTNRLKSLCLNKGGA